MAQTATITSIKREFNLLPNIVGIVTTADLTTITTADYWLNEQDNINSLNNGEWEWQPEDLVLIYYSDAQIGFFTFDATTQAFISTNTHVAAFVRLIGQDVTTGGSATEIVSVPGVVAGDWISVQLTDTGSNNVSLKAASAGTDSITLEFSADPGGDTHFMFYIYESS